MEHERREGSEELKDTPERRAAFRTAIFGSGGEKTPQDKIAMENAGRVAEKLIESGFSIATGGYGGVMKVASEAAAKKAEALGLKPEEMVKAFTFEADNLKAKEVKKAGVSRSKTLPERLTHLIDESGAYVIVGGGQGTVVELFTTLENENLSRKISGEKKVARPVIIIDPSLKHSDLLTSQARKEPKLQDPEILNNVYILSNQPEAIELANKIIEASYQQSLGASTDEEILEELKRYNLGEFIRNQNEFKEGGGI